MKTRLSLTICLAIFLSASSALAQDVNGLKVGEKYTRSQIIKALGTPENVYNETSFCYAGSRFNFDYFDWTFTEFYVNDPRFLTMTEEIEGGLRVGDDISKVKKTKLEVKKTSANLISYWYYGDWAVWNIHFDEKGKITGIGFTILN